MTSSIATPEHSQLRTVASYLPDLVIRRRAVNVAPLERAEGERFPAAVLLADVSGFTRLTEDLARKGPAGAEELSRILNRYFGGLIDTVHAHGGEVFKFAGDALLVLWPLVDGADPGLDRAVGSAAACALALHEADPEGDGLALRVAIGAGEMLLGHVGGVLGRWEYFLTGAPLGAIGAVLHAVDPGRVAVAPEALELLGDGARVAPLPGGGARLVGLAGVRAPEPRPEMAPPPESEPALRQYLPGAIRSRVEAGQTGWLSELRQVTVLFLNLPGLTHETPLEQAHETMRALQAALYRFEGSINKLSVDDKGVSLVAATGLPPLSHEDDPVRGVRAALAMQAVLKDLGLRGAVGLATGRAFCGEVGNSRRREYTLLGDVVNLAARLMQAAGDGILCDEATFHASRGRIRFLELPPLTVKGKAAPVATHRPLGLQDKAAGRKLAMVGREAERALLAERLAALMQGESGAVVVEGEGGIGKSRLVETFSEEVVARDIPLLRGEGDAIDKSTPYHAWRPLFGRLFDLDETEPDLGPWREQALAMLRSRPEWARLAPLASVVLPLDLGDDELTREMTGQVRAENTCELLVALLRTRLAGQPAVLVIEDAHWLDSASWVLLKAVWRRVQPLLLILATRPFGDASCPSEFRLLREGAGTKALKLDVLPPGDLPAMIAARLGCHCVPDEVVALIHERSGGHPFFATELVSTLQECGAVTVEDCNCRVSADLGELKLPDTVQGVITSRVDRLPPPQQLTLKVASVIGRVFAYRILRDIYPLEADRLTLPEHLAALDRLDLTPLDTPEPDLAYLFKHVITQQVVYDLLLFSQRKEIHAAVARWYERTHEGDLAPFFPLLAHHWERAGCPEKAIDCFEQAGEAALAAGAFREAGDFFGRCLALRGPATPAGEAERWRLAEWELGLGAALNGVGDLAAIEHGERALALIGRPQPGSIAGFAGSLFRNIALQALHRLLPRWFVGRIRSARVLSARKGAFLGEIYFVVDQPRFVHFCLDTLNFAEARDADQQVPLQAALAIVAQTVGQPWLARVYERLAVRGIPRLTATSDRAPAHHCLGCHALMVGNLERSMAEHSRAEELAEAIGDRRLQAYNAAIRSQALALAGRFEEASAVVEQWAALAAAEGWGAILGSLSHAAAYLNVETGRPADCLAALEALEGVMTAEVAGLDLLARGGRALAFHRTGRAEEARTQAGLFVERLGTMRSWGFYDYFALACGGEALFTFLESPQGRKEAHFWARSVPHLLKAINAFCRANPIGWPLYWRLRGRALAAAGKQVAARNAFEKGLAQATAMGMAHEQRLLGSWSEKLR